MPSPIDAYPTMVAALEHFYGPPLPSGERRAPFEAAVALALSRGGNSGRAEKALGVLSRSGMLTPKTLAEAEPAEILDLFRESRVTVPAHSIPLVKRLARWFAQQEEEGSPRGRSQEALRGELRAIRGIGPALADGILLAMGHASPPVDRGTYRVLVRHGWIDPTCEYDEAGELLKRMAGEEPGQVALLSEWLRRVARQFCGLKAPRCAACPLLCVLPPEGPVEPDV
jgi:endonuclease-3 related protein